MTMPTYKELRYKELNELPHSVGIMVAVPRLSCAVDEFENPTPIDTNRINDWKLEIVSNAYDGSNRKRSMAELLFCMLRAGH